MTDTLQVNHFGEQVFTSSGSAWWETVIAATELDGADATPITNPDTEISTITSRMFQRENGRGTIIRARVMYDDGATAVTTDVQVKLFGRFSSDDAWQPIRNKVGNITVTMTIDVTNDATDGTYNYTTPELDAHSWDCDGFDEFVFGVEVVLNTDGDDTIATLEARII